MDNASDFESEGCRFESCHAQFFLQYIFILTFSVSIHIEVHKQMHLLFLPMCFWKEISCLQLVLNIVANYLISPN